MAKASIQAAVKAALEAKGYIHDRQCRSSRYIAMCHPDATLLIYLGTHGAVRRGRNIADSVPISEKQRQLLIETGRELLTKAQ